MFRQIFDGFYLRLNNDASSCISLSNTLKSDICKQLNNIHSDGNIPNYFNPSSGKCEAFVEDMQIPGIPSMTLSKINTGIRVTFIEPVELGNPEFTHYSLSFRKKLDNSQEETWSTYAEIDNPEFLSFLEKFN